LPASQARRTSIVRTVYGEPSVLMKEEAAGAADPEAERAVKLYSHLLAA
jgi:ABC-type lipoprotein export system ATPase subunit